MRFSRNRHIVNMQNMERGFEGGIWKKPCTCFGDLNQSCNFLRPHCVMCAYIELLGRRSVVDCGIRMNIGVVATYGNILPHQRTYEGKYCCKISVAETVQRFSILLVKVSKLQEA